jgi:hypothetical protein
LATKYEYVDNGVISEMSRNTPDTERADGGTLYGEPQHDATAAHTVNAGFEQVQYGEAQHDTTEYRSLSEVDAALKTTPERRPPLLVQF